jgi:hypothetical protein
MTTEPTLIKGMRVSSTVSTEMKGGGDTKVKDKESEDI